MLEIFKEEWAQIALIIIIVCLLYKLTNIIFKKIQSKGKNTVYLSFLKGIIQAIVVISGVIKIGSYSDSLTKFTDTILLSSSLLVVVLGFVFQEGLSIIVHGFIILLFKPFELGDRIHITIDNDVISGNVSNINLRHTTITGIIDNAPLIVPNSKLDLSTIKNYSNGNDFNKYPIKIDITYNDATNHEKRILAKQIISDIILSHPLTLDMREDKTEPLFIKTELCESSVKLTCWIITESYENNFKACSEITEEILDKFTENNIDFAFPHQTISGKLEINSNDFSNPTYIKKTTENIVSNILKNKKEKGNKKQS